MRFVQCMLFAFLPALAFSQLQVPFLKDIINTKGLNLKGFGNKWGGPCIADLDNDGFYDIVFWYHMNDKLEIFFGGPGGTFTRSPFGFYQDLHGASVTPLSVRTKLRMFGISPGGARGDFLRPPYNFIVNPDRTFTNVTFRRGLGKTGGRGRQQLFLDLSLKSKAAKIANGGGPDILVFNFLENGRGWSQWGYENVNGERWALRRVPGIETNPDYSVEVTNLYGLNRLNVITYPNLRIYNITAPFTFREITRSVLPDPYLDRTILGVAEFDMDNDGDMDLYIARSHRTDTFPDFFVVPYEGSYRDVLLRNDNGRYVDVTAGSNIAGQVRSLSVTTGDFDNNGYVDLFVSIKFGSDIMLLNKGDGTFQKAYGTVPKRSGVRGNHAVGVDIDQDGRVDLMVGQGGHSVEGPYRIMKNLMFRGNRHYLLVRVGNDPTGAATNMHAIVQLRTGPHVMTRRVGSRGATDGGHSYIDTVHFGLGTRTSIQEVKVTWTSGTARRVQFPAADRKIQIGSF